jgi:SAM-dependent methyltransferase
MSSSLRFDFGKNWQRYLTHLDQRRIEVHQSSLANRFGPEGLSGKRFLDAGSGSGVFSRAAASLGAYVTSFDYDPASVACTKAMREQFPGSTWDVFQGSLLDETFLRSLGSFDIVYCWGVAHHTGDMWCALQNLIPCCRGDLVVSIYNDQGKPSRRWRIVKRAYNGHIWLRPLLFAGAWIRLWGVKFIIDTLRGNPWARWRNNNDDVRGMSAKHDLIDWVGGYPFEVAKPEQVFHFFHDRGFELLDFTTQAGGIGCNEFVFRRRTNVTN